jgi:hypothetical protein
MFSFGHGDTAIVIEKFEERLSFKAMPTCYQQHFIDFCCLQIERKTEQAERNEESKFHSAFIMTCRDSVNKHGSMIFSGSNFEE